MRPLRIDICNERLLPRFGVDRLLVLLARKLVDAGHEVRFVCLRCDKSMLLPISRDVTVLTLPEGLNMEQTEEAAAAATLQLWQQSAPDAVVVGGWPFLELAARAGGHNVSSLFIDAGAVAQDGFPEPQLTMQRELRRIRQLTLPSIECVLPISDFIRNTQSEPDRGRSEGVHTVLLGGDHMALGTFGGDRQAGEGGELLQRLEGYVKQGEQLVLALGRFEAQGYKNSAAAYDVLRMVRGKCAATRLLLLDAGEDCNVPRELATFVELLGAPDDLTLQEVMRLCSAGISTSLWEGFNLPVAEMQWIDRPALAFNLGAHPEVIAEPWLLCENSKEMAAKLTSLLNGNGGGGNGVNGDGAPELLSRFAEFRARRQWEFTLSAWETQIVNLVKDRQTDVSQIGAEERRESRIILVDVTNAALDPANPGVIRVVRRLCSELQYDDRLELVFAAWSRDLGEFIFLDQTRRNFLQGYGGPRDGLGLLAAWRGGITPELLISRIRATRAQPPVLLLPEVMFDDQAEARLKWAQRCGFKTAAILYDLIPIFNPELCDPNVCSGFPAYLQALAQVDAVWTISDFTLSEFSRYLAQRNDRLPSIHEAIHLPGQFGEQPRNQSQEFPTGNDEIRILFVSTLEPRKNHKRFLQAYRQLRERRPDLPLRLVLIGNRYAGAPEIAEEVQALARRDSSIQWLGTVDDESLAEEFRRCTFTVYPSLVEGYGLPIVESLWMGRPCLAHDGGVMRELATPGGCTTVDMTEVTAIAQSLERLITDQSLLQKLRREALQRKIGTWRDYAETVAQRLCAL
jgi:glycosyltransferase involved in cell wall biosynthesis